MLRLVVVASLIASCTLSAGPANGGEANPPQAVSGYSEELIVPLDTYPANHGSTVVELKSGGILTCWFAGSAEAEEDVRIVCSRKTEETWTTPRPVVDNTDAANESWTSTKFVGNPVLYEDRAGDLWLFYESVPLLPFRIGGHSAAYVDYKVSRDGGESFSLGRRLVGGLGDFGHLPRNKPIPLGSEWFMVPVYREFISKYGYTVAIHRKEGRVLDTRTYRIPGKGHLQPTLVHRPGAGTHAYLRSADDERPWILHSAFDWDEREWSGPQRTNLPNPNAAVDAVRTANGQVLIAYNHSPRRRTPLSLALSNDGVSFERVCDLEDNPEGSYSYPALIKDERGRYHITYTYNQRTIKHVAITADRVKTLNSKRGVPLCGASVGPR